MNRQAGFTTLETLVSIALVAIAGAIIAAVSTLSIAAIHKSNQSIRNTSSLIMADGLIRGAASRVRIPYWVKAGAVEAAGDSIAIHWLDGVREATLSVGTADGKLLIEESGAETSTRKEIGRNLADIDFEAIQEGNTTPSGIRIRFKAGGSQRELVAAFGSSPLAEDER